MTGDRPCIRCRHVATYAAYTQSERLICTRSHLLRAGGSQHMKPSCAFERDAEPAPHRVEGDKCSVEGRHWEEKA